MRPLLASDNHAREVTSLFQASPRACVLHVATVHTLPAPGADSDEISNPRIAILASNRASSSGAGPIAGERSASAGNAAGRRWACCRSQPESHLTHLDGEKFERCRALFGWTPGLSGLSSASHRTQAQQPVGGHNEMVAERVSNSQLQQAATANHEVAQLSLSLQGLHCRGTMPCSLPQTRDGEDDCQRPIISWRPAASMNRRKNHELVCVHFLLSQPTRRRLQATRSSRVYEMLHQRCFSQSSSQQIARMD
jgi:hypothetical protein